MRSIILYLAFLEGVLVMTAELSGAAAAAPYYGSGLTVWTFILGITMFALATGYFVGGLLLPKVNVSRLISFCIPLNALFLFLMPQLLGSTSGDSDTEFSLQVLKGLFPVFFPPLFLSGIISTTIVQAYNDCGKGAGESSGMVYGVSTLGGIVTALLTGTFLMEYSGLLNVFLVFSMVGLSGTLLFRIGNRPYVSRGMSIAATLIILLVYGNAKSETEERDSTVLYKNHGVLGEVKVTRDLRDNTLMFYVNNSLQSTLGYNGYASLPYVKYICYFLSHRNKGEKVLLAGMGGGNVLRDLKSIGFSVDVVEMDKRVVNCAREYFNADLKNSKVVIDDARHYINTTHRKYEIIVLDLSVGETIPSNVYTIESFRKMKTILNENGIITLHLFSTESGEAINSIKSLGKTMQSAGFETYLLNTKIDPVLPSPYIFVASRKKINFNRMNYALYNLKGNRIFGHDTSDVRSFDFSDGIILTDDRPMLELFQRDVVAYFRKNFLMNQFLTAE